MIRTGQDTQRTKRDGIGPGRLALAALLVGTVCVGGCADWRAKVDQELPLLGHRNWIVIADAAYPAQSRAGIETIATRAGQLEVVQAVLNAVDQAPHVRPVIYVDSEMKYVSKKDSPGIEAYRKRLDGLLKDRGAMAIPHEELIAKLDEAAKVFRILILKTDFTVPYTSVFLQLECGYWDADSEKRLRKAITDAAAAKPK